MDEQFQHCQFLAVFQIEKKSRNLLVYQFGKFQKFSFLKIPKIINLENSINVHFGKIQILPSWEIRKNFNSANSKKFQF